MCVVPTSTATPHGFRTPVDFATESCSRASPRRHSPSGVARQLDGRRVDDLHHQIFTRTHLTGQSFSSVEEIFVEMDPFVRGYRPRITGEEAHPAETAGAVSTAGGADPERGGVEDIANRTAGLKQRCIGFATDEDCQLGHVQLSRQAAIMASMFSGFASGGISEPVESKNPPRPANAPHNAEASRWICSGEPITKSIVLKLPERQVCGRNR